MNKLPLSLIAFGALAVFAQAQVTTTAVGFNTVQIPAGSVATPSYTTLSFPLAAASQFTGPIASVDSATSFTMNGAAWTANQFVSASAPCLAKVTSGTNVGRFFLITANTTSQLTVDLGSAPTITDLTTALSVGDSVQVLPANTLGTLFGTTPSSTPAVQFVTGATASNADNVWVLSGQTWGIYYNNGNNWKKSGSLANQNNTIIFPDEGVLVVHTSSTPLSLTFTGTVPVTNEKSDISGSGSTFVANRYPVDQQLINLGIQSLPGWVNATSAAAADNVWAWNPTTLGWDTFYYNGNNWKKSGSLSNQNSTIIPAGTAVIIIKNGSTSAATLAQTLPYTP